MTRDRALTVLLVEDEPMIAELVCDTLCAKGFKVHAVADGQQALDYVQSDARIDIMLTDIFLGGSMNGVELATKARALRPELPVVYSSGQVGAAEVAPLVPRSVFVPKPYDVGEICTLLGRLATAA